MASRILSSAVFALSFLVSPAAQGQPVQDGVDALFDAVASAVSDAGLQRVLDIDHARLAAEAGVPMPPSRVQIFSDPGIDARLLAASVRTGLDLPFRVLTFAEGDVPRLTYTSAEFLGLRHGLTDGDALDAFDDRLATALASVEGAAPRPVPTDGLTRDYGIAELRTSLDVPTSVARLKAAVTAQPDTIWFGEIDLAARAAASGTDIVPAVLLLFGGPAPGGVAMAEFPAIGIDAFCQKLLVHAAPDGGSVILFNDIAALARLHYGRSAPPHAALDERLTATFTAALAP